MILNSKIIISKGIKLDRNYDNVLSYNPNEMLELMMSDKHMVASANDYSFIRKTGRISTGFSYSQCLRSNYIAFQNIDYSNKWFFAWIDTIEYKSEKCTEIAYTIDVWSTFFTDITLTSTMVLREHTLDDSIGSNIMPENVNIGAYKTIATYNAGVSSGRYGIGFLVSDYPTGDAPLDYIANMQGGVFNGMSGGFYRGENDDATLDLAVDLINTYNSNSRENAIQAIYAVPSIFFETSQEMINNGIYTRDYSFNLPVDNPIFNTIKNKKLLTYPYTMLEVSDNNGNTLQFAFEYFENNIATFTLKGRRSPLVELCLYPDSYKGDNKSYDNQMFMSAFPTCAYATDYFKSWYNNNYQQIENGLITSTMSATVGAVTSIASGNIAGVATSAISLIGKVMDAGTAINKATIQPNQIKGAYSSGNINLCEANKKDFTFRIKTLMQADLVRIDNYFTMFGYAVNKLKLPNLSGRKNYNYIQIAGNIGYGDVPSYYMETINNACNKGVTIWHNHEYLGEYAIDNSIN